MPDNPKILAFAGSLRTGSYNKKLVKIASAGATESGADVTYVDLKDYPMPIYDGDVEDKDGLPPNARELKDLFLQNQGLLIACPENNGSFPAAFKNALDWLSRPVKGFPPLECFVNKTAVIMAASTGYFGGVRVLIHLRQMLNHMKVIVLPEHMNIPNADDAFDDNGALKNPKQHNSTKALGRTLCDYLKRLS
jgi:NAD(P)H-dependent FMN reductase